MARARSSNGSRLEEAMALLMQAQADLLARTSESDRIVAETRQENAATNRRIEECFVRIEAMLAAHTRILLEVVQQLKELRDTIREHYCSAVAAHIGDER